MSTALAGCRVPAVDIVVATSAPCPGPRAATLIGRSEGGDAGLAAFANAMNATIFDFDDTHQDTVMHHAAPVFAVLFVPAESTPASGAALFRGFVIDG